MTYLDLVNRIKENVNVLEIFPDIATNSSLAPQILDQVYVATLVVSTEIPLKRLPTEDENPSITTQGDVFVIDLPSKIFIERSDHGIVSLKFDDHIYDIDEFYTMEHLRAASANPFQQNVPHAQISPHLQKIYFVNAQQVAITYVERPSKPTPQNYNSKEVPLIGNDLEVVNQLVAAHLTGIQGGDPKLAALHKQFSQLYLNRAQ